MIVCERDKPMVSGVHHIAIIASSEASVEFYSKLGFKEIFRKARAYDTVVLMEGYGIKLEIFVDSNHPNIETNPERLGLRHLSLKVDSCEEMNKNINADLLVRTGWEKTIATRKIRTDWL